MFETEKRCYDTGKMMMPENMMKMPVDPKLDMNHDGMVTKADMCMPNPSMTPMNQCMPKMSCCKMQPIVECPVEKCVHRTICHEVPHVCPVNTKIINHHIYKHTYAPSYSCCEENEVSHVQEGSCCNFR